MPTQTFLNLPQAKQDRVMAAAVAEFSQRNVEEAVVSNIVRAAGIPRGSLYQYFVSKEDLYVYMFELYREQRRQYVQPAFAYYKTHPFLTFFQQFYIRDSTYLLQHPQHIELGKVMYSHARGVSLGLIQSIKRRYHDIFIVGIDYDQDLGRMRKDLNAQVLADLCVHFVTDVFMFQNLLERLSITAVQNHLAATLDLLRRGVETGETAPALSR